MSENISQKIVMELETVDAQGNREPTGHRLEFTSGPTDLEGAMIAWYATLQKLLCSGEDPEELSAMARRLINK